MIAKSLKLQLDRVLKLKIPIENLIGFEEQCDELVHKYKNISYAMVMDLDGKVLFHNNAETQGTKETNPKVANVVREKQEKVHEIVIKDKTYFDAVVPVFDALGKHIGQILLLKIRGLLFVKPSRCGIIGQHTGIVHRAIGPCEMQLHE